MRILYVASDQVVPGRTGGSVHVLEVARTLAAMGHELHVIVSARPGEVREEARFGVTWHRIAWRPHHRIFRFRARATVGALLDRVRPDAVMERYYNFGGEGVLAARDRAIPSLLEVNSPVVDHPRSVKAWLDAALLLRPMRSYREALCRQAAALVAPIPEIVPPFARDKTEIVTWGANVDAFHPSRRRGETRARLGLDASSVAVLFSGSFRPWHGVHVLEAAARRLAGRSDLRFVLAGGGRAGSAPGDGAIRLGALPYDEMPELVAACDIGVAPYDTARHAQLSLGFYWSPLKVFEYMASGLPTVTIRRPPLSTIVRDGEDGLLFDEGDAGDLARVLLRLAGDPDLRRRFGASARERVVERYSWERHCRQLDAVLRRIVG
jgi:glycosyltransferase involved in cell wall biosynthesis